MKNYANRTQKGFDDFMLTGISTACFYPMLTEEALEIITAAKIEAAEVFVNCNYEISPHMLKLFRSIADANGVKILSFHPYTAPSEPITFFSRYQRRFDEGLELYRKFYDAANILGADIVVFHGGSRAVPITYNEYIEKFGLLVEDAKAHGSSLCHENVERCTSWSPDFFRRLAAAIPDAGFVFDVKQAVRAKQDVFEFVEAMGTRLRHVHFSDNDSGHECLLPGKGTFNTEKFLEIIAENGFDGGVIVELYRENFSDIVELLNGYQHLFTKVSTARKNAETSDNIRQSG